LVDRAYKYLTTLLTSRGLSGPADINDVRIAESLGVSRTPVRAALARLESEGLVIKVQGKGWIAAPLTLKDIEEIFVLLEVLEVLVARHAAERITPQSAKALKQIVDEMGEAVESSDLAQWYAADNRYHDLLYRITDNSKLRRIMEQLNAQWYRFTPGYMSLYGGQMPILYEQHRAIAEAIISGDPHLACENTKDHLALVRQNLVTIIDNVSPFIDQSPSNILMNTQSLFTQERS
jgi:DNA-binding GntR family transcriptional regulator